MNIARLRRRLTGAITALPLAALIGHAIPAAAVPVVVPPGYAGSEAPDQNGYPFGGVELDCAQRFHYQQLYDGSQVGSGFINSVAFRLEANSATDYGPSTFHNLKVTLSSTSRNVDNLSTTFANNIGADETLAYQGDFTASLTDRLTQPNPFGFVIPVHNRFEFDGGSANLLVDIRFDSCEIPTITGFDAVSDSGLVARVYRGGETSTGNVDQIGLITQFDVTPGSGLHGIAGNWAVVGHNGEGFLVDVTKANQLVVFWFTYDSDGNQVWLFGVADDFNGNSASMDLTRITGPSFGPDFDAGDRSDQLWGTLDVQFEDCDQGSVHYESITGFGTGDYDIERIYRSSQSICP